MEQWPQAIAKKKYGHKRNLRPFLLLVLLLLLLLLLNCGDYDDDDYY